MITLVDYYNRQSWDLHYSMLVAGYTHPVIAINDDGFLPEDVTSPYLFYTGFDKEKGEPLYFNQVQVPEFWEIRGDNSQAEIFNYHKKQGHIHYAEPSHLRHVKAVDWYDMDSRVRVTDRYNKFGYRYAQSIYNTQGQMVLTTYFNKNGEEVIVENHLTGDIILNHANQVQIFKNRHDFARDYLRVAGYQLDRICYNSLSTPFLVTLYLNEPGKDILFWQEDIHDEIPGNMQVLLKDQGRETRILVQNRQTYEKMLPLLTPEQQKKVDFLGYQYPFVSKESYTKSAFILTNSDQLEQIDALVQNFPDVHFHIGALTEMSSHLMRLGVHPHVSLYQNIDVAKALQLFKECSVYLDINHYNEILSAVRTAFEHKMLILAFENTQHNPQYIAPENVFRSDDYQGFASRFGKVLNDITLLEEVITLQEQAANLETSKRYKELIG